MMLHKKIKTDTPDGRVMLSNLMEPLTESHPTHRVKMKLQCGSTWRHEKKGCIRVLVVPF